MQCLAAKIVPKKSIPLLDSKSTAESRILAPGDPFWALLPPGTLDRALESGIDFLEMDSAQVGLSTFHDLVLSL